MLSPELVPVVYVVIPVRDRWAFTFLCLESLAQQSYLSVRTCVVDDGSSDETADGLRRHFPDVTVLDGDGQLWWTGATALGVGWALQDCSPDDYILTLNNDTVVERGYVEALVAVANAHNNRALVGSVAVDGRDRDTVVDGGPTICWATAKHGSFHAGESLKEVISRGIASTQPDVLPGRGTLIPVRCFREIGTFDTKRLPHYGADYEFSARARRAGYELVMSYDSPVFSEVEATGLSTKRGRLGWSEFWNMFVSRRSPACLLFRWRFGVLSAPGHLVSLYLVMDTARVVLGGLRDQLRGEAR